MFTNACVVLSQYPLIERQCPPWPWLIYAICFPHITLSLHCCIIRHTTQCAPVPLQRCISYRVHAIKLCSMFSTLQPMQYALSQDAVVGVVREGLGLLGKLLTHFPRLHAMLFTEARTGEGVPCVHACLLVCVCVTCVCTCV